MKKNQFARCCMTWQSLACMSRTTRVEFPGKAVVLAAGFGTRLLPLSLDTPKPMVPIWGKPALGHVLDMLHAWGVRETLINLHFQPQPIFEYASARSSLDFRVSFSFEPEILGTGGALRRAAWFLPEDEPFWLINADIAADVNPEFLLAPLRDARTLASLWLHPLLGPRTVEMNGGLITSFKTARPETEGTYTFCGLHLLRPEILRYLPESGFAGIISAYECAMTAGLRIAGACDPCCYWEDIGTPESYLRAHGEILERWRLRAPGARMYDPAQARMARALQRAGARIEGFAALGKNVVVEPGARVVESILWDGARVARGASVLRAVVGTNTFVQGEARRMALRPEYVFRNGMAASDPLMARLLRHLRWPPEQSVVEPFEPRGSARSFVRLRCGRRRAILVRYSLDRHENGLYAAHARFLKRLGLRVPEVLVDWPGERLLALEDLGRRSLQDATAGASASRLLKLYKPVLDALLILHGRGARLARAARLEMTPPFSRDLYRWEREFFARHFLKRRLNMPDALVNSALKDLASVASGLVRLPAVLVHRDMQSSNVLFVDGRPAFIDFQGMRLGPAVYDLASLLCDPYVDIPEKVREQLLDYYAINAGWHGKERDSFLRAAVERLAQALGAYARLGASADTAWFARYIPPALKLMRQALEQLPGMAGLRLVVETAMAQDKSAMPQ